MLAKKKKIFIFAFENIKKQVLFNADKYDESSEGVMMQKKEISTLVEQVTKGKSFATPGESTTLQKERLGVFWKVSKLCRFAERSLIAVRTNQSSLAALYNLKKLNVNSAQLWFYFKEFGNEAQHRPGQKRAIADSWASWSSRRTVISLVTTTIQHVQLLIRKA